MAVTRHDRERAPPAPEGWATVWSQTRGRWYFRNDVTKATAWEVPKDNAGSNAAGQAAPHDRPDLADDQPLKPTFDDLSTQHHLQQVVVNTKANYTSRTDMPFSRVLEPGAPRAPYRRRNTEIKTVINWPQRRLLLSEIEFLTRFSEPGMTVVYASVAPGVQLKPLTEFFPNLRFVVYDSLPLAAHLENCSNLTIRTETFSDAVARTFAQDNALFISNLRSGSEASEAVSDDLAAQISWCKTMRPRCALLNFRLPWQEGTTPYFDGEILLPVWSAATATESRLIVQNIDEMKDYDNNEYEQQMFYFNTVQRVARYDHNVEATGIDHCYDCRAEVAILDGYVAKYRDTPASERPKVIASMSELISSKLALRRTLLDSNPEIDPRRTSRKRASHAGAPPAGGRDPPPEHRGKRARSEQWAGQPQPLPNPQHAAHAPAPQPAEDEWS
eukprot:m.49286 g.49286  ORF g.49286 m.49286 type:complete len:444 (+) comp12062_c0_seq3:114-1445(+)